jgi:hypothetical protein
VNIIYNIEYTVPEFAEVEIENITNAEDGKKLAITEFERLYPEAIDPEIISWKIDGE